jgi:hypothetical protein
LRSQRSQVRILSGTPKSNCMEKLFDEDRWGELLAKPDWYLKGATDLKAIRDAPKGSEERERFRDYFTSKLSKGEVALAESGEYMDIERKTIDTIIIHHTSNTTPYSLEKLNAVHLFNLYIPYYTNPYKGEERFKGKPIWSGHFIDGKQVFYAYHWLIRRDGSTERLIDDDKIGWQAGDWVTNCRSIAICLDDDYSESEPPKVVLDSLVKLIQEEYREISKDRIIGHLEVCPERKKSCPGDKFLSSWKQKVIRGLEDLA